MGKDHIHNVSQQKIYKKKFIGTKLKNDYFFSEEHKRELIFLEGNIQY